MGSMRFAQRKGPISKPSLICAIISARMKKVGVGDIFFRYEENHRAASTIYDRRSRHGFRPCACRRLAAPTSQVAFPAQRDGDIRAGETFAKSVESRR